MRHNMRLHEENLLRIRSGRKKIEVRLFDEKRQKVKVGDEIEFSLIGNESEKVLVKVFGISIFDSLKHLYSNFNYKKFGHPDGTTLQDQITNTRKDYSEEREKKYGAVGIHIQLI